MHKLMKIDKMKLTAIICKILTVMWKKKCGHKTGNLGLKTEENRWKFLTTYCREVVIWEFLLFITLVLCFVQISY